MSCDIPTHGRPLCCETQHFLPSQPGLTRLLNSFREISGPASGHMRAGLEEPYQSLYDDWLRAFTLAGAGGLVYFSCAGPAS